MTGLLSPTRRLNLDRLGAERLIWVGIAVLIALRIGLSLDKVARAGLDMDETLFVNAATLRIPGLFITQQFDGIPSMVFPYIGH